jgi:hypothetical protein
VNLVLQAGLLGNEPSDLFLLALLILYIRFNTYIFLLFLELLLYQSVLLQDTLLMLLNTLSALYMDLLKRSPLHDVLLLRGLAVFHTLQ